MSIHPDIKKAIELIDQRIEALRNIRESLAKEFGMEEFVKASSSPAKLPLRPISLLPLNGETKTRKQQVIEYLTDHGTSRRKEIASGTGIPEGTVSYVLNDKNTFAKMEYGKWGLVSKQETA